MSKKLTTKEFIERAKNVHGDKYDYSKVNYINCEEKVCIICPIHGEFWQIATEHLQGHGACFRLFLFNMGNVAIICIYNYWIPMEF